MPVDSGTDPAIFSLTLEHVSKEYPVGDSTVHALRDVSLEITAGEFIVITGASGSGKSTLLSLIASLEKPTRGKILVNHQDASTLDDDQLCDLRRNTFGIVFQFFSLHPFLTARQNVEMPMLIAGVPKKSRKPKIAELLRLVGMSERASHDPSEMSGGEQQRIGIARALANDPSVLLADEPTGHLDADTGQNIMALFVQLNRQYSKTIVMVTHNENLIVPGMRILRMLDGQITSDKIMK